MILQKLVKFYIEQSKTIEQSATYTIVYAREVMIVNYKARTDGQSVLVTDS